MQARSCTIDFDKTVANRIDVSVFTCVECLHAQQHLQASACTRGSYELQTSCPSFVGVQISCAFNDESRIGTAFLVEMLGW